MVDEELETWLGATAGDFSFEKYTTARYNSSVESMEEEENVVEI